MRKRSAKKRANKKEKSSKKFSLNRVREGDIYTVVIEDYSNKGEGIARLKDTSISISDAKIGEVVKVKITSVKFKKAKGEIMDRKGNVY